MLVLIQGTVLIGKYPDVGSCEMNCGQILSRSRYQSTASVDH